MENNSPWSSQNELYVIHIYYSTTPILWKVPYFKTSPSMKVFLRAFATSKLLLRFCFFFCRQRIQRGQESTDEIAMVCECNYLSSSILNILNLAGRVQLHMTGMSSWALNIFMDCASSTTEILSAEVVLTCCAECYWNPSTSITSRKKRPEEIQVSKDHNGGDGEGCSTRRYHQWLQASQLVLLSWTGPCGASVFCFPFCLPNQFDPWACCWSHILLKLRKGFFRRQ